MKKNIILLPIVLLIAILACYHFYFKPSTPESSKTQINIIGENSSTIQAMVSLEREYEESHPTVDLVFHPNTFDDAFTKSNQDFANKTGLYDIVIQYNFSLSSFVENNYVYFLKEINSETPQANLSFESELFDNYWQELGYYFKNAKSTDTTTVQVGYPSAALTMLLMYNKELFDNDQNKKTFKKIYNKDLAPPSNWEDFFKIAEFFTNNSNGTKGVCIEGATGGFLYFELMNFIGGMGGKVLETKRGWDSNKDTKLLLNSKENAKILAFYKSLKPFNSGGFFNVEQFEQMRIMKEGKTAMALVWSDMIYPSIKTENGFDNRFGFAPMPGNHSILGGGAFFVNKQTKNLKEVSKLINYLLQPSNQVKLAEKGFCSPLKTVYSSEKINILPYSKALEESLERADIALVAGADANVINEVITTYVQKLWNDELTPEQALSKAQEEINAKRVQIFTNKNK